MADFDWASAKPVSEGKAEPNFDWSSATPVAPKPSALSYIAQQAKAGLTADLPTIAGKALQYTGQPGDTLYDVGTGWRKSGEEAQAQVQPDEDRNIVTRGIASTLRGAAPIVPIAAGGLALHAFAPEVAVPLDIAAAGGLGAAFGGAAGQDTLEKAKAQGVPEDQAISAARKIAAIQSLGMGAAGAVSGGAAAPLIRGLIGAGGKTAGEVVARSFAPEFTRPALGSLAGEAAANVGSMTAANVGQAAVEQSAGITGGPTPGQAAVEGLESGLGFTAALSPFSLGRSKLAQRQSQNLIARLQDPQADPALRGQIADRVAQNIHAVDPEAASVFRSNVQDLIDQKQPVGLSPQLFQKNEPTPEQGTTQPATTVAAPAGTGEPTQSVGNGAVDGSVSGEVRPVAPPIDNEASATAPDSAIRGASDSTIGEGGQPPATGGLSGLSEENPQNPPNPVQRDEAGNSVHPTDLAAQANANNGPLEFAAAAGTVPTRPDALSATETARIQSAQVEQEQNQGQQAKVAAQEQKAAAVAQDAAREAQEQAETQARAQSLQAILADKKNDALTETAEKALGPLTADDHRAIRTELATRALVQKEADQKAKAEEASASSPAGGRVATQDKQPQESQSARRVSDSSASAPPSAEPRPTPRNASQDQAAASLQSPSNPEKTSGDAQGTVAKPRSNTQADGREQTAKPGTETLSPSTQSVAREASNQGPSKDFTPTQEKTNEANVAIRPNEASDAGSAVRGKAERTSSGGGDVSGNAQSVSNRTAEDTGVRTNNDTQVAAGGSNSGDIAARHADGLEAPAAPTSSPTEKVAPSVTAATPAREGLNDALKSAHETLVKERQRLPTTQQQRIVGNLADTAKSIRDGTATLTPKLSDNLTKAATAIRTWDNGAKTAWAEPIAKAVDTLSSHVEANRPKSQIEQRRAMAAAQAEAKAPEVKTNGAGTETAKVSPSVAKIEDVGEKIGGARKDTSIKTGSQPKTVAAADARPTWRKQFEVSQIIKSNKPGEEGKWAINDTKNKDFLGQSRHLGSFDTKEQAEAAIPLYAVALKHSVNEVRTKEGEPPQFEITRKVGDRKRVRVVAETFPSREDAMRYMAQHATDIVETKTSFGEEILPKPDTVKRIGAARREGDVQGEHFKDSFGLRGVEFGNWNNQEERQAVMNHAYDALADLAEVLNIPPRALGLNGELGLAFGARGQGLSGARAHYERDYGVINLTKMSGAGSLAHEWFHSLDHYFGRQDGKAGSERVLNERGDKVYPAKPTPGQDMASYGFRATQSGVRPELREAYTKLIRTMFQKGEQYVEDTARVNKFVGETRKDVSETLGRLRAELSAQRDGTYYKRHNAPASAEQLATFDGIAERLIAGEGLETRFQTSEKKSIRSRILGGRWTNDALEAISAIYKDVRGRSGFGTGDQRGVLDNLRGDLTRYSQRLKMLADAQEGTTKTKTVPTSFAMEAKSIDQGRASDYWSTEHEMAARAFQSYVEDKIAEGHGKSDFLTYGTNLAVETPWGWKRPFPTGSERVAINDAFDKFMGALQTKETDKGVALASMGKQGPSLEGKTPLDNRLISQVQAGASAKDVLRTIAAESTDPMERAIAMRFLQAKIDPELRAGRAEDFRPEDLPKGIPANELDAMYDPTAHVATFFNANSITHDALHEIAHAGTVKALDSNSLAKRQMETLYNHVKSWGTLEQQYGLSSLKEFVAETYSSKSFQRELMAIPAHGGIKGTAWTRFVSIVRGILGLDPKTETALSQVLQVGEHLLNEDRALRAGETKAEPLGSVGSTLNNIKARIVPPGKPTIPRPRPVGASFDAPEPSKLDSLIYRMQDKHIDTRRVVEAITAQSKAINDSTDVYLQEELFHGRAAKETEDFLTSELKPLVQDMQKRGVTIADLEQYLHARHAEERNVQIAKINPALPDEGSGMKTADAQAYLTGLNMKQKADYAALAQKVDAITKGTQQTLINYGLESPDTINAWNSTYKNYVPLQREEMETAGGGNGTGQGISTRGDASQRATGSTKGVENILANVAIARERAIVRGEKNRVANALVGLVESNPNSGFWKIDQPPKVKYVDDRTGLVAERIDPLYKSRDNVVVARAPDASGEIHERAVVFNEFDERAMRMARSLKNLDADQLGEVLGAAAKATRYFAAVNTQYNPVFGVVNVTRDVQGAMLNLSTTPLAGKQKEVLQHTLSALKGIYTDLRDTRAGKQASSVWANEFEEFQKYGGKTGYRDTFRTSKDRADAIQKEVERVSEGKAKHFGRAVFNWLSDYNEAMENAVRLATYKTGKDNGLSKERAASVAKNITVNFNRKGQAATQIGALYAFFNANAQGTARLLQTLNGPLGKRIIYGGVLLGVMQALGLSAAGYDDDEPPDFVKEKNLVIPIGDKKYVTIPLPLGLHFIPNIGRISAEYVLSGFRDPGKRFTELTSVFADAFNPVGSAGFSLQTIAPTIVDPFAALAENKDFTGKPIYRPDSNPLAPTPGYLRAKDTATMFGKTVSQGLNYLTGGTNYKPGLFSPTPDQIDYLVGQATGGAGREAAKLEQSVSAPLNGETLPSYKIPLAGRFYGDAAEPAAQVGRFYDNIKTLNEHEAEIKGRAKFGEPLGNYMTENPEARLIMAGNAAERAVSKLRHQKRELQLRHLDTPERVKSLDDAIAAQMTALNQRVRSAIAAAR